MAMTATAAQAEDISVWDGSSYSASLTVQDKNIYIRSANDFAALRKLWKTYKNVSGSDGSGYDTFTIYLECDIDLGNHNFIDWCIGWESGNEFGGHFDGQGHVIKNLYIYGESANRGLFGYLNGGNVRNLKIDGYNVRSGDDNSHVGVLCGRMVNHSTISHCAVVNGQLEGWILTNDDELGLICGYADGNHNEIEYCYADGSIYGNKQVGGIVGKMNNDPSNSTIRHCYFSGTVLHKGDEYFAAIAGERYGNELLNNFYLDRSDGVKGTGNQSKYGGSSDDPNAAPKTDAELKAPLLFGADNTEWVYPLDSYPELKVFLRYNTGDTFYEKNIGYMGSNAANVVPGYLKVVSNAENPCTVELTKILPGATGTDFTVIANPQTYFSDKALTVVTLAENVFQDMGVVNTVTLPATLSSIAAPQRHQVQNAFTLSGASSGCAVEDGVLYDVSQSLLITAPKSFSTLTIHQQYASSIADYAFEDMSNLKTLYVDTWVPAGTLVDDGDNKAPVMALTGTNTFNGSPSDLDIYIKDGTNGALFYGRQGPKGYGYCNADGWDYFYSDYEDVDSHLFSYFPVNRNAGGASTLVLGYPVELPAGVTAWWAHSLSDGNINLQKLGTQLVPALTPVLLTYDGTGPLYLSRYTGDDAGASTDYEGNMFKGSVDPGGHTMTASEMMTNFFTLGRPTGDTTFDHLGFYPYHPKNNILPSYAAWIASSDIPAGARWDISFDETTRIESLTPSLSQGEGT